jgi:predicted nucleotidyltransferase
MVYGLERFKESFINHTNQYVLIGGTACDILMNELGTPFRATKDLDMVLIVEALDESFEKLFGNLLKMVVISFEKKVQERINSIDLLHRLICHFQK